MVEDFSCKKWESRGLGEEKLRGGELMGDFMRLLVV